MHVEHSKTTKTTTKKTPGTTGRVQGLLKTRQRGSKQTTRTSRPKTKKRVLLLGGSCEEPLPRPKSYNQTTTTTTTTTATRTIKTTTSMRTSKWTRMKGRTTRWAGRTTPPRTHPTTRAVLKRPAHGPAAHRPETPSPRQTNRGKPNSPLGVTRNTGSISRKPPATIE